MRSARDRGELYRASPSPLRPGLTGIAAAAALAIATLAVVPVIGMIAAPPSRELLLREAPRVVSAPPPAKPAAPTRPAKPRRKPARPKLHGPRVAPQPRNLEMAAAALSLPMSTLDVGVGDVALDFTVRSAPRAPVVGRDAPTVAKPATAPDRPARAQFLTKPQYPVFARRKEIEGVVELLVMVGADGRVTDVRVLRSEPEGVFDAVSTSAARQWRYRPALRSGRPVPTRIRQILRFQLEDDR